MWTPTRRESTLHPRHTLSPARDRSSHRPARRNLNIWRRWWYNKNPSFESEGSAPHQAPPTTTARAWRRRAGCTLFRAGCTLLGAGCTLFMDGCTLFRAVCTQPQKRREVAVSSSGRWWRTAAAVRRGRWRRWRILLPAAPE
eukprot:gene10954-biopygen7807